jgi:glycogen synthase
MKILALLPFYYPFSGGAERLQRGLMIGLESLGFRYRVLTTNILSLSPFRVISRPKSDQRTPAIRYSELLHRRGYDFLTRLAANKGVQASVLPPELETILRALGYPLSPRLILDSFRASGRFDVILAGQPIWSTAFMARLASEYSSKPYVVVPSFHVGHPAFEHQSTIGVLQHANCVFAQTVWEQLELTKRGIPRYLIKIIGPLYNPISTASVEPNPYLTGRRGAKFLFLGRKDFDKGYYHFIDALSICVRRGFDVSGVVVGQPSPMKLAEVDANVGRYVEEVKQTAKQLGDRLTDLGSVSETEKLSILKSCNALVLPSRVESFGLVLLEAFNFSKPVIVSDKGPLPDIVGDAGFVVPWGNVDRLADSMSNLATNQVMANEMGGKGFAKIPQYSATNGLKIASVSLLDLALENKR